jgi:hypothetical protein
LFSNYRLEKVVDSPTDRVDFTCLEGLMDSHDLMIFGSSI